LEAPRRPYDLTTNSTEWYWPASFQILQDSVILSASANAGAWPWLTAQPSLTYQPIHSSGLSLVKWCERPGSNLAFQSRPPANCWVRAGQNPPDPGPFLVVAKQGHFSPPSCMHNMHVQVSFNSYIMHGILKQVVQCVSVDFVFFLCAVRRWGFTFVLAGGAL
jgi:hypothetical protein